MAITKCRIWLPEVNRFTGTRTCFMRSPARHGNVSININLREIMSKTNDTSKLGVAALEDHDALEDSELDAVNGGLVVISIIGILVGLLLPAVNSA